MERGAVFGELALLYNAPRSATIKCMGRCVLWSLKRELFKYIQALAASAEIVQRSKWLVTSPDLAILTPLDLSRLVLMLFFL
jgi:CRP-like cAMP-binding protein